MEEVLKHPWLARTPDCFAFWCPGQKQPTKIIIVQWIYPVVGEVLKVLPIILTEISEWNAKMGGNATLSII